MLCNIFFNERGTSSIFHVPIAFFNRFHKANPSSATFLLKKSFRSYVQRWSLARPKEAKACRKRKGSSQSQSKKQEVVQDNERGMHWPQILPRRKAALCCKPKNRWIWSGLNNAKAAALCRSSKVSIDSDACFCCRKSASHAVFFSTCVALVFGNHWNPFAFMLPSADFTFFLGPYLK